MKHAFLALLSVAMLHAAGDPSFDSWWSAAHGFEASGQWQQAIAAYRQAASAAPDAIHRVTVNTERMSLLIRIGRPYEACDQWAALEPDLANISSAEHAAVAWNTYSTALSRTGRVQEATDMILLTLSRLGQHVSQTMLTTLRFNLATRYLEMKNPVPALGLLTEITDPEVRKRALYNANVGIAWFLVRDWRQAAFWFDQALTAPNFPLHTPREQADLYKWCALVMQRAGRRAEAKHCEAEDRRLFAQSAAESGTRHITHCKALR